MIIEDKDHLRWASAVALAKIGWWEADFTREIFLYSDVVVKLLGIESNELSFQDFTNMICEDYRDRASVSNQYFKGDSVYDQQIPLTTSYGKIWVLLRAEEMRVDADGVTRTTGVLQRLSPEMELLMEQSAQQRLDKLLSRQRSISNSLLAFIHKDGMDEVVNTILHEILTSFRCDRSCIVAFGKNKENVECLYEVKKEEISESMQGWKGFSMSGEGWWSERILNGMPLVVSHLDQLPPDAVEIKKILVDKHIKSIMAAPLFSEHGVWGYVGVDTVKEYREWSNDDYEWFVSLANVISICLLLRHSEEQTVYKRSYLYNLFKYMPVAYLHLKVLRNGDCRILDCNNACDRLLGKKPDECVGKLVREVGLEMEEMFADVAGTLNSDSHRDLTHTLSNGRICHIIVHAPKEDELMVLFSDMTDTFRAHDALERSEAILRNIYDNLPLGIERYDENGILVDVNTKELEIFGLRDKSDALGVNLFDNPIIPEGVKECVKRGEQAVFSFKYDFGKVGNYYETDRTGVMDFFTKGTPLYDSTGKLLSYLFINIDNTELLSARDKIQEFEEFFTLVGDYAKVGYAHFNVMTNEGYAIDSWYKNIGEQQDRPLREVIRQLPHAMPEEQEKMKSFYERVIAGEAVTFRGNIRIRHDDGHITWTCTNIIVRDYRPEKGVIEVVGINYDITELKEMEIELIKARNKAETSDRLKSAFLANMSHEIRTPLNAIVGFSEVLASSTDVAPEEKKEYVNIIENNNKLLLQLISDILDLSKIEAGTLEFVASETDLNDLFKIIETSAQARSQNKDVEIIYDVQALPCCVQTEKNRLSQVINNLINNAMKFTSQGSIHFGYKLKDPKCLYFYVTDTGCGIPEDKINTIFGRFVKLNKFAQGTGLGLSICQTIVEYMGGEIGIESQEGKGATFWFTLPYCPLTLEKVQPEVVCSELRELAGEKLTILIAEDNESNYRLFEIVLQKEYNILHAWNGKEAVEMFQKYQPQFILMDINMPVMNGYEATNLIRAMSPVVPIVAVTAYAFAEDEQRILASGFDAYASKPIKSSSLKELIMDLARKKIGIMLGLMFVLTDTVCFIGNCI